MISRALSASRRDLLRQAVSLFSVAPIIHLSSPTSGDDTATLQSAIDRLPRGGILDGGGRTFIVTKLLLKSDLTIQNINLRAKGTSKPLDSVLTIDGNVETARDIVIQNVHIDGNRASQTNLLSEEDGGRDGIRIVGRAERVLIADSSATNCATDGLKIFSHRSLSHDDAVLNFRNIYVRNCRFFNNRRHGASGDSLRDVFFEDCEFSANGVDVPGRGEGCHGAIDKGTIYGAGIDVEGYGPGSGVTGLYFLRCRGYRNARFAFQFWEPTPPRTPGFIPRSNIVFENCSIDGGVSLHHGHQALEMSQPYNVRSSNPSYRHVRIIGLQCAGTVVLNGVQDVAIAGGHIKSPYPGFWGVVSRCKDIAVLGVNTDGKILSGM